MHKKINNEICKNNTTVENKIKLKHGSNQEER